MDCTIVILWYYQYCVLFFRLDQDMMHKWQYLEVNSKRNYQNRSTLL